MQCCIIFIGQIHFLTHVIFHLVFKQRETFVLFYWNLCCCAFVCLLHVNALYFWSTLESGDSFRDQSSQIKAVVRERLSIPWLIGAACVWWSFLMFLVFSFQVVGHFCGLHRWINRLYWLLSTVILLWFYSLGTECKIWIISHFLLNNKKDLDQFRTSPVSAQSVYWGISVLH